MKKGWITILLWKYTGEADIFSVRAQWMTWVAYKEVSDTFKRLNWLIYNDGKGKKKSEPFSLMVHIHVEFPMKGKSCMYCL